MAQCATPWIDQSCCPEDLLPAWIWQGTWISGRTYAVNAAVESDGSTWTCIKSHTSDAGNRPPDDPAVTPLTEFWELMALGGNVIKWEGAWDIGRAYEVNDAVEHLGSAWIALKTSTGVEPGTDATAWELLVQGQAGTSAGYAQRFAVGTDTSLDPGPSNFTINVGDTEIATDDLNIDPADISAWIADFAGGTTPGDLGQVTVKEQANPDKVWKRYLLTAVTADTGFTRLTVALVDSAGVFTATRTYAIEFARTGDLGGGLLGSGTSIIDNVASWADAATPGTTLKDGGIGTAALIANDTKLAGIEAGAEANVVDSVFTRIGAVVAAASDYDASQVDNDSGVTGAFVSDALDTLDTDKAAAAGNATLAAVQTFTAGQRKQVTEIATWVTAWDIDDSNDFNVTAQVSGAAGNFPIPTETLANGEAQAGEITLDAAAANTAGFAAGWDFPGGTAPDISGGGLYTLYYRIWQDSGGVVRNRITGLAAWS